MIKEKTTERHFTKMMHPSGQNGDFFSSYPKSTPCGVKPLNGTEQALKSAQFALWLDGKDHKLNVRGTFDLSSPHVEDDEDEWSSNSFCTLDPELNLPWVTPEHVAHGAAVLRQIGSTVKFFKVDLHRSYQQVVMQRTATHRQ